MSLSTSQWGGGGALIGDMRDLAYIRVLLEVEDKVG